jgi:hypothetical protein
MTISSRTARIATASLLVGAFAVGSGASPIQAGTTTKAPSKVTTIPPKLPRTKNGALTTTVAPKKSTTTSMPRIKNGKPKSVTSAAPKGS